MRSASPHASEPRPTVGVDAAFGELRHLRSVLEKTPPAGTVSTQGWNNLERSEWPFFALVFYADAATRLARLPISPRRHEAAVAEARWALARAHDLGINGAEPLLPDGHLLLALSRFAHDGREGEYRALCDHLADGLEKQFARAESGMLPSYRSMWWTLDPVPALAALLRSARRVAPPVWREDELTLPNVPPVGQAALLRAKVWDADAAAIAGHP